MEVFKDSIEQALRGPLKWGDGTILVALNICPGASAIINPLYSSGFIVTPVTSKIIIPTSLVMGEWAHKFPQYKYYVFVFLFHSISIVGLLSIYYLFCIKFVHNHELHS